MPIAFLLAMQAAGMVVDWLGTQNQAEIAEEGLRQQKQAILSGIRMNRLSYEEESLQAMVKLRQNLGTQAAALAARGTRGNAGNSILMTQESIGNYNADERIRKINELSKEANLWVGMQTAELHQKAFSTELRNKFIGRTLERIPTQMFSQGFGLTKVGSQ